MFTECSYVTRNERKVPIINTDIIHNAILFIDTQTMPGATMLIRQ